MEEEEEEEEEDDDDDDEGDDDAALAGFSSAADAESGGDATSEVKTLDSTNGGCVVSSPTTPPGPASERGAGGDGVTRLTMRRGRRGAGVSSCLSAPRVRVLPRRRARAGRVLIR